MNAIAECGAAGWLIALATFFSIPFALSALALALGRKKAALVVAGLAFSAALLPFTLGVFGEVLGRSRVDAVLKGGAVDPAHHATIQATGYAEAAQCKKLGTGGSAAPGLVALVALGLALSRREPAPGQGQGPGHGHGPGPDHGASG